MRDHQESPDTRIDRYICSALMVVLFLIGDRLLLKLKLNLFPEQPKPVEFLVLAFLAGLFLYLLWLLLSLFTVRYELADHHLILRQGLRRVTVPLDGSAQLHRWRNRWGWSDGARRDLGVEAIPCFPPVWFWRPSPVWVMAFRTERGEQRAVAFRPSAGLLALLRDRTREEAQEPSCS